MQQTKSFGQSYTGTSKGRHCSMEPLKFYGGKTISNKYVFNFFRKVSIVSEDLMYALSIFGTGTFGEINTDAVLGNVMPVLPILTDLLAWMSA